MLLCVVSMGIEDILSFEIELIIIFEEIFEIKFKVFFILIRLYYIKVFCSFVLKFRYFSISSYSLEFK